MAKIASLLSRFGSFILAALLGTYTMIGGVLRLPIPIRITVPPTVMIVSETEYAVIWRTSGRGTGSLLVTRGGELQVFHDSSGGSIRSDDKLHVVRVPKDVLDGCDSYQVHSQYVLFSLSYVAFKGLQTTSDSYTFRGYAGQEQVRALFFSDVHGTIEQALRNTEALTQDAPADLIILGGDITRDWILHQKTFADEILTLSAAMSGGNIPVLYCRGNHETRGQWGTEMRRYFPTQTNEMYYTASYGPISFTVLDTGEDKEDSHPEYAGLADFETYRAQQDAWLRALPAPDDTYDYRVCVAHDNNLNKEGFYHWFQPLSDKGITHLFCGHGHHNSAWTTEEGIACYEDGGRRIGSLLIFERGEIRAQSVEAPNPAVDFGVLA